MSFTRSELKKLEEADRQIEQTFRMERDDFLLSRELDREAKTEGWTKKQIKNSEYTRRWYAKNRQSVSEQKKEYYQRNRERILAYRKAYRGKNREEINAYNREMYRKKKLG